MFPLSMQCCLYVSPSWQHYTSAGLQESPLFNEVLGLLTAWGTEMILRFSTAVASWLNCSTRGILHVFEAVHGGDTLTPVFAGVSGCLYSVHCGLTQAHAHPIHLDRDLQFGCHRGLFLGLSSVILFHFVQLFQVPKHPSNPLDHCCNSLQVCLLHG